MSEKSALISDIKSYGVSAKAYLLRAKYNLNCGTPAALFYAAFELRCCVETRQADYAEALLGFDASKVQQWKVGETRKRIEKIVAGKLISHFLIEFDDGVQFNIFHTPIPQSLSDFVEKRSGDLLHSRKEYRSLDDQWWSITREDIVSAYRSAWLACQGNALVPPLWNPNSKKTHPLKVVSSAQGDREMLERLSNSVGQSMNIRISYLEHAPLAWICDY
jgi:hypothetical protein